jgi:hypothetical protein
VIPADTVVEKRPATVENYRSMWTREPGRRPQTEGVIDRMARTIHSEVSHRERIPTASGRVIGRGGEHGRAWRSTPSTPLRETATDEYSSLGFIE